jgi:hypothetical protein
MIMERYKQIRVYLGGISGKVRKLAKPPSDLPDRGNKRHSKDFGYVGSYGFRCQCTDCKGRG